MPAGYLSYQLNPNLWLGMSLNSPFGLSVGFPETLGWSRLCCRQYVAAHL